jgi:pimeloyl-ACP methyl ester carboxylesterase
MNNSPVILLHGYPFDRSMWRGQIDFLNTQGYQVVAPDLLGPTMYDKLQFVDEPIGEEPDRQAEACRTMADMARDVEGLMDALRIDQAVICGLSMGGYVAFEFMHLFAERVRALILAGTRAPADNEQERLGRLQQVEQMLTKGMDGIAESSLPKLLSPRTIAEKPDVVERVREMILRADPHAAAAAQRGMAARRDYSSDLPSIKVPALIVVGRQDPIRPVADAELMHKGIPNSRLEIIEDAAHMTNMEQPEIFNRAVMSFLGTITL